MSKKSGGLAKINAKLFDEGAEIPTFEFEDIVGRTVSVKSICENNIELIVAIDIETKDSYMLKEIIHPASGQ